MITYLVKRIFEINYGHLQLIFHTQQYFKHKIIISIYDHKIKEYSLVDVQYDPSVLKHTIRYLDLHMK